MGPAAEKTIMEELIRFLGIDREARRGMEQVWSLIEGSLETIIGNFYVELRKSGFDMALSDQTIDRLKTRQKEHWRSLFASRFDQQYFNSASLIGIKHYQIGLDPKWYIAGYAKIKTDIALIILESPLPAAAKLRFVKTLDNYVALDTALAISAYTALLVD